MGLFRKKTAAEYDREAHEYAQLAQRNKSLSDARNKRNEAMSKYLHSTRQVQAASFAANTLARGAASIFGAAPGVANNLSRVKGKPVFTARSYIAENRPNLSNAKPQAPNIQFRASAPSINANADRQQSPRINNQATSAFGIRLRR